LPLSLRSLSLSLFTLLFLPSHSHLSLPSASSLQLPSHLSPSPSRRPAAGHLARGCASARAGGRHGAPFGEYAAQGPGGRRRRARNPPSTDDWAGRRCYFGPFAGDEHHQVRPPLGLPLLLCETVRPNPNLLFVFGSESNYYVHVYTNFGCYSRAHKQTLEGRGFGLQVL